MINEKVLGCFRDTEEHFAIHTSYICFAVASKPLAPEKPWTVNPFRLMDGTMFTDHFIRVGLPFLVD